MRLTPTPQGFEIDAEDLAPLLGLPAAEVQGLMRDGRINCLSEEGRDDDAGKFRVSFRHGAVRVRFTIDADGRVLSTIRTMATPAANAGTAPDGAGDDPEAAR